MNILAKVKLKQTLIFGFLTVLVVYILFKNFVKIGDFVAVYGNARLDLIFLAIGIGLSGPLLSAMRWRFILGISGYWLPFKKTIAILLSTWPLSILPGRVGDFARSYPIRKSVPVAVSAGATLFEKITDIIVLVMLSGLGFLFLNEIPYSITLFTIAIIALPMLFVFAPLIIKYLPEFAASKISLVLTIFKFSTLKNKYFFIACLGSAINWFVSVLEVWILFMAFGATVPIKMVLAYLPLSIFVGLLPISIAGVGTRDSVLITFFIGKATSAQSFATGMGYSFIGYFLFAIIGIPFLIKEFGLFSRD